MQPFLRKTALRIRHVALRARDAALEGIFFPGDEISQNRGRVLGFNISTNIRFNFCHGNFLTGLLLYMQADDAFIGLVGMLYTAAHALQIFSPLFLRRFARPKRAYILIRSVFLFANVVVTVLLPLIPGPRQMTLALFAVIYFASYLLGALHFPALTAWHIKFIPQKIRSQYFSFYTICNGIVTAVAVLLGGRLLDVFNGRALPYEGLLTLRLIALLFAGLEIFFLAGMKDNIDPNANKGVNLKKLFVLPFKQTDYLKTAVLSAFLWNLIANIPGSYYTVYLLSNVKVSYTFINFVSMLNVPILIVVTPFWAKYVQCSSWIKCLCVSMFLYCMHYLMLPFVTASSLWLYVLSQILAYVMMAGINLAFSGIPYVNLPCDNQSTYIAFYSTMANVGAFFGAYAGRTIITMTAGWKITFLGVEMISKQYFFFFIWLLMTLASGTLYLVQRRVVQHDG